MAGVWDYGDADDIKPLTDSSGEWRSNSCCICSLHLAAHEAESSFRWWAVVVEASDNSLFLQRMRTALVTTMTSFRCFLQTNAGSYKKGTKHANLSSW